MILITSVVLRRLFQRVVDLRFALCDLMTICDYSSLCHCPKLSEPGAVEHSERAEAQSPLAGDRAPVPQAVEETGGFEPNPKPNLLIVATGSRLDSLQAKSLEPGPTKHCNCFVYTGRRNKKEDRSVRDFFWRKLRASSQPQIQTLCSSGLDRCN